MVDPTSQLRSPTVVSSLLFVPGNVSERFAKALAGPADLICLDLEDAVPPVPRRRRARLSSPASQTCRRVSDYAFASTVWAPQTGWRTPQPSRKQARDLELLAAACPPKRGLRLIALLESPLGVEAAFEIARSPAVSMPMFGSFDYAQKRNALRIGPCS
jgi:citrate lyase beta subunit